MRGLAVIIIIALMVVSYLNWTQIRQIHKDIDGLRQAKGQGASVSDHAQEARDLVERAARHMDQAAGYIEKKDLKKAKGSLDRAIQELDTAASLISEKPSEPERPLVERLRDAAASARESVAKRLPHKEKTSSPKPGSGEEKPEKETR
jgi:hypothetical protein